MPCYHPLKAYFKYGRDGSRSVSFVNSSVEALKWDKSDSPDKVAIPCGQCVGCRLAYSRQWAVRCVLESQRWDSNFFITLTYSDEYVPLRKHCVADTDTGEVVAEEMVMTLQPEHLTKFNKDLRRYYDYHYDHKNIRFFACGEYGNERGRPHYHGIFFNLPIDDLKPYRYQSKSHDGHPLYESETISSIWGKGLVCIAGVSFDSCAYTARYIMKKHKGNDRDYYERRGIEPEFTRCSRKPGIARDYYDQNSDHIYTWDQIVIAGKDGKPLKLKPPSYFDRLYDIDYPDKMLELKEKRKEIALLSAKNEMSNTSLSRDEYLCVKEQNKLSQIKVLTRSVE